MTSKRRMTILLVAVVVVALVATMFTFVACNKGEKTDLKRPEDVFALAGVSTGAMLNSMANSGNVALGTEVVADDVVVELNEYMAVVEALVAGNPDASKVENSDREGYAKVQVMNVPDMNGKFTKYMLYYNEGDKVADEDADEGEEEYESHITGIMVIGDNEFPITGDIEVEKSEDEVEQSIEFVAYLNEDKTDYIKFENETETETEDGATENETEYSYKIYKNGAFDNSFKLEVENEGKEESYEIKTKDKDGNETVFELEKEANDIKVKYTKNGTTGTFKVESTTDADGNPVYKYILSDKEIELDKD